MIAVAYVFIIFLQGHWVHEFKRALLKIPLPSHCNGHHEYQRGPSYPGKALSGGFGG